jgi:hypothetical protein
LWVRSEQAEIYLSSDCVGLRSDRASVPDWVDVPDLDAGLARIADALTQVPMQSCGRVRIWLGSTLARPLMLTASAGARNRDEAKALAGMLAADATGFVEPVRVWANAWRPKRGGMAVVMPERVWTALNAAVDEARNQRAKVRGREISRSLELISVRPWWNQAVDAMLAESARDSNRIGWSLAEADGVVHGIVDNGEVVEAGFDAIGPHDADGSLLRRRLAVNWEGVGMARHLAFVRDGGNANLMPGGWRELLERRA